VIRAGSIGRDIVGKVKSFFIRRRGRGASSRLIPGEITALWCQANRPASWALPKPYEKTGGWQGNLVLGNLELTGEQRLQDIHAGGPKRKNEDFGV
jgi:hypothetical protein